MIYHAPYEMMTSTFDPKHKHETLLVHILVPALIRRSLCSLEDLVRQLTSVYEAAMLLLRLLYRRVWNQQEYKLEQISFPIW